MLLKCVIGIKEPFGRLIMMIDRLDHTKRLEVLLYVASRVGCVSRIHTIIYFANRYHLERYGRFVINDLAMIRNDEIVLLNLQRMIDSLDKIFHHYTEIKKALTYYIRKSGTRILIPKRMANLDYLSESDIECLNEAIGKIKSMSPNDLILFSHDDLFMASYPNKVITLHKMIDHSFNSDELREYLAMRCRCV